MSPLDQKASLPTGTLSERLKRIKERINFAAQKSGRSGEAVCLVAVTKTIEPAVINEAIALGLKDIGESKIQEAAAKRPLLAGDGLTHHLIGHLQTNKVKKAVDLFHVIQSVDSLRLAEVLNRAAGESGKIQRCHIEVKVSSDVTKTGILLSDAGDFLRVFKQFNHLKLEGLMTIGPLNVTRNETRAAFRSLRQLFESHRMFLSGPAHLSMGMSDDFELAIEEGSTMVRIGRALWH